MQIANLRCDWRSAMKTWVNKQRRLIFVGIGLVLILLFGHRWIAIEIALSLSNTGFATLSRTDGDIQKHAKDARQTFDWAIGLDPTCADCYFGRGLANYAEFNFWIRSGILDFEKPGLGGELVQIIVSDFGKTIELDPSYGDAYYYRGLVNHQMLKSSSFAISDLTRALDQDPKAHRGKYTYPDAYYWRGVVYEDTQQYQVAIQDFTKVIELNPKYTSAYMERGRIYATLGKHLESIADFSRVIQLDPRNFYKAYYHRAIEYAALKNYPRAIADMERFIQPASFTAATMRLLQRQYGGGDKDYEEAKRLLDEWKRLLPR